MAQGQRILAIDYGSKNIGLACSDALGMTVQPLPSIPNLGKNDFVRRIQTLIQTMGIQHLVFGMPLNMDGTRGDAYVQMEHHMHALSGALKIPATGVDERLSTLEALEIWNTMNPRRQRKYRTVDSLAAALILERYLREI